MPPARTHFGYHFSKLHRLMLALCKQNNITDLGIQPGQIPFVVELLNCDGPVTQDELSAALVVDKAATARALERLERNGFVTRVENPENRRQKLVSATEKALSIRERLYGIFQSASATITRDFRREDMDNTLKMLNQMIANAKDALS